MHEIPIKKVATALIVHLLFMNLVLFSIPAVPTFAQAPAQMTSRLTLPLGSNANLVVEAKNGSETQTALISDSLASTKVILSSDGSTAATPTYYPYGAERERERVTGSVNNRYYTGQRKVTTGDSPVYNYNARYYNPDTGIFTQPDSVQGPNRFAYVGGNPVLRNDPSGHVCVPCVVGVLALVGMMTTSPMSSTVAYTPGEIAQVNHWKETGGPEMNYFFSRMLPGIGQGMGVGELLTGTDALGRGVGPIGQVANVVDVGLGSFGIADTIGGGLNTARQSARVMQYEGGEALLSARTTEEAMNAINKQNPSIWYRELTAEEAKRAGGYYSSSENLITYGGKTNVLGTIKHEGVHALQDLNGHPGSEYRGLWSGRNILDSIRNPQWSGATRDMLRWNRDAVRNNFDLEMMAYSTANKGTLFQQIGGAMWSTSSRQLNAGGLAGASTRGMAGGMQTVPYIIAAGQGEVATIRSAAGSN